MKILALAALLALLQPALALAQASVTTVPQPVITDNASSSIAVTNTFQVVFAAKTNTSISTRYGCAIQNTGSNVMYVYVHKVAAGSATKNNSYQLIPPATGVQGGSFSCSTGSGGILQDQIDITGTAGDTFTATSQ